TQSCARVRPLSRRSRSSSSRRCSSASAAKTKSRSLPLIPTPANESRSPTREKALPSGRFETVAHAIFREGVPETIGEPQGGFLSAIASTTAAPPRTVAAPSSLPRVAAQPLWLLMAGVGFFVLLKLAYFLYLPPIGDEAYYWLWGQHPELSYLDHPPLHAWLLGLVSLIFGWNLYSLRLLTWLTFGVNAWIFWLFAKRLAPENPRPWFWATLLIYLGSPIMFVLGTISFH